MEGTQVNFQDSGMSTGRHQGEGLRFKRMVVTKKKIQPVLFMLNLYPDVDNRDFLYLRFMPLLGSFNIHENTSLPRVLGKSIPNENLSIRLLISCQNPLLKLFPVSADPGPGKQ